MRTPYLSLISGGADLMNTWGSLVVEATITDERGDEADKLSVTLDDNGGRIAYPPTGAIITAKGGYRETGAAVVNEFKVDGVTLDGWPQRITIEAASVDAQAASAKERKPETHRKDELPTLGDLIDKIAQRNQWTAKVAEKLKSIPLIDHLHQTEESDAAFLNRIVQMHDGMISVKEGNLVAVLRGSMESTGGASLGGVTVAPGLNLLSYRVRWADRPTYGEVEARYFDRDKAEPVKVTAPVKKEGGGPGATASEIVDRIREAFPTKDEAQQAADARARELQRGDGSATFEIEGDPTVGAEVPVQAQNIRSGVDGLWVPTRVEHRWSKSGYRTRIECETPGSDSRSD